MTEPLARWLAEAVEADGELPQPVFLLIGDRVAAEPPAVRLGEELAKRWETDLAVDRHPPDLGPALADLRTMPLFGGGKVTVVVESAVLADAGAAAELIDAAAEALPVGEGDFSRRERRGAGRLLQALALFGAPDGAAPEEALSALPPWAFQGGTRFRKGRKGRGRGKKQVEELRDGLAELLLRAREEGQQASTEGELAELGEVVAGGLPERHALILVESAVSKDHPLVRALVEAGRVHDIGRVSAGRGGGFEGLDLLTRELERETGARMRPEASRELARRTLRIEGGHGGGVEADSTARFAAEYRKLASIADGGEITLDHVETGVEDRGDEEVWGILDAIGGRNAGEALERMSRFLSSASDPMAARLSLFGLLAGYARQLAAVRGALVVTGAPAGERNYRRFKDRIAPALQGELPGGFESPLAKLHPFRLHRAYLAASGLDPSRARRLPGRVLEAELLLKGDSRLPEAVLADLVAELASAG